MFEVYLIKVSLYHNYVAALKRTLVKLSDIVAFDEPNPQYLLRALFLS